MLLADGCQAKRINILVAEKAVLNELEKLRLDPSLITDESGIIDTDYINVLESDISVIDDQLNRLVDLYLDGHITREKSNQRRLELSERRDKLESELNGLELKQADISTDNAKMALSSLSCIHDLDYETQKNNRQ